MTVEASVCVTALAGVASLVVKTFVAGAPASAALRIAHALPGRVARRARPYDDQALQSNCAKVPESPCHWRSLGSDQRLPLLLARSMLAN